MADIIYTKGSIADCYSYSWNTNSTGDMSEMYVEAMYTRISLIKFDLSGIPIGKKVVSAELRLYQTGYSATYNSSHPTNQKFNVSRNTADFNENTVYNSYDPNGSTSFAPPPSTDSLILSPKNRSGSALLSVGWDHFDVTSIVKKWITDGLSNYGFKIRPYVNLPESNENQFRFATKEYRTIDYRPSLVIIVGGVDIKANVNGTYRGYDDGWVMVGGVWRQIDDVKSNVNGSWKQS